MSNVNSNPASPETQQLIYFASLIAEDLKSIQFYDPLRRDNVATSRMLSLLGSDPNACVTNLGIELCRVPDDLAGVMLHVAAPIREGMPIPVWQARHSTELSSIHPVVFSVAATRAIIDAIRLIGPHSVAIWIEARYFGDAATRFSDYASLRIDSDHDDDVSELMRARLAITKNGETFAQRVARLRAIEDEIPYVA